MINRFLNRKRKISNESHNHTFFKESSCLQKRFVLHLNAFIVDVKCVKTTGLPKEDMKYVVDVLMLQTFMSQVYVHIVIITTVFLIRIQHPLIFNNFCFLFVNNNRKIYSFKRRRRKSKIIATNTKTNSNSH